MAIMLNKEQVRLRDQLEEEVRRLNVSPRQAQHIWYRLKE